MAKNKTTRKTEFQVIRNSKDGKKKIETFDSEKLALEKVEELKKEDDKSRVLHSKKYAKIASDCREAKRFNKKSIKSKRKQLPVIPFLILNNAFFEKVN